MIKRYCIIATDYEEMSVEKHPLGDWCKAEEAEELEKENEKLRGELRKVRKALVIISKNSTEREAVEIADKALSKDKEEV